MKTKQIITSKKPIKENREIGLLIKCLDCNTGRMFKISENLKLLLNKVMDKFKIETFCEECDKKIEVSVGWINKRAGFSYRGFSEDKDILSVEDLNGLGELE